MRSPCEKSIGTDNVFVCTRHTIAFLRIIPTSYSKITVSPCLVWRLLRSFFSLFLPILIHFILFFRFSRTVNFVVLFRIRLISVSLAMLSSILLNFIFFFAAHRATLLSFRTLNFISISNIKIHSLRTAPEKKKKIWFRLNQMTKQTSIFPLFHKNPISSAKILWPLFRLCNYNYRNGRKANWMASALALALAKNGKLNIPIGMAILRAWRRSLFIQGEKINT